MAGNAVANLHGGHYRLSQIISQYYIDATHKIKTMKNGLDENSHNSDDAIGPKKKQIIILTQI